MHVHIGFVPFVITGAYVIITLFLLRWIAATFSTSPLGKAAAAIN